MENVAPKERIFTANFLWLCFASFGAFGSFYLLLASLPVYIKRIGGVESEIGIVLAAFSVTSVLVRPFVGAASDQRGKKGLMLGGVIVMLICAVLYEAAKSIPLLFILRLVHGVGWGVFSTASSAFVADVIPASRRGEAMGYFGIFGSIAMATGPAAGMIVADSLGFFPLFWLSAAVAGVGLISTIGSKEVARRQTAPTMPLWARLFHRRALFPAAILFCSAMSYGSIVWFLSLFVVKQQLGNPGLFFTAYAIVLIVARGPVGRLSDRYGRISVIAPGLVIGAAALALLATTTSMAALLMVAILYAISFAAIQPTLMALTVDRVDPAERGSAMGTFSTAMDLGISAGAVTWGVVAQFAGYETMYYMAAVVTLLGLAVILGERLRQHKV